MRKLRMDFGKIETPSEEKLSYLDHSNAAHMLWKSDALKKNHCLVRILDLRHRRYVIGPCWSNFFYKKWKRGYVQHLVSTGRPVLPAEATLDFQTKKYIFGGPSTSPRFSIGPSSLNLSFLKFSAFLQHFSTSFGISIY